MGLHLVSSNRVEVLLDRLSATLLEKPLASPFSQEIIIVPGMVMSRWVNLQLAQKQGIAANIAYPLLASWVWQLSAILLDDLPPVEPLTREISSWKIYGLLPGLLENSEFVSLRHYLTADDSGLKRWQLSTRIADAFDRYQYYRPQDIKEWSAGGGDDWQAILWRELTKDLQGMHRVALLERLVKKLHFAEQLSLLPERISLFAMSSMAPLFIEVINALSLHTEVYLYQHSPTNHYWADLKSKKELSRKRISQPDEADYYDSGNELLASWGRQGQALQDLLLNSAVLPTVEHEEYPLAGGNTLLERIQQDIFNLEDSATEISPDDSIQVSSCYSELRECQALHDQLLREFENNGELKPEDVLVMIPEISRYAPYIETVFARDTSHSKPFIPWNISDISMSEELPLFRVFYQLLSLPTSRFAYSELISYLDVPEVLRRFDLNPQDCDDIRELLLRANLRWGIDAQHKQALGLPAIMENSWEQAEQRLFAGYALGDVESWNGISVLAGVESDKALSLGKFWRMFDLMKQWRLELTRSRSASDWQLTINRLLVDFFSEAPDDDGRLQQIRDVMDGLQQQAVEVELSTALLRHWLNSSLGGQSGRGRQFSGGVTFCGMQTMRSLPFNIICLLGMNDAAYPRRDSAQEFDRMARSWRAGDPCKGDEDRYLLLEALLCARQKIYLSYVGRSMKDNSERQPSVLLRELMDFIDAYYPLVEPGRKTSECLTTLQPMQAFSPRNFQGAGTSALQPGFDRYWCEIAMAITAAREAPALDAACPLENIAELDDEPRRIELNRLQRFLQHPVKHFFNTRLGIYLGEQQINEDEETFELGGLQSWGLKTKFADDWMQQRESSPDSFQAQGLLPHGAFASRSFEQQRLKSSDLLRRLQPYRGHLATACKVDIGFEDGQRLSGQVNGYYPGLGLLHYSASSLKGKLILRLWLDHLCLCAGDRLGAEEASMLICTDRQWHFTPVDASLARDQLQSYIAYYRLGMQRPLPLFPAASYAFASAKDDEAGIRAAYKAWASSEWNKGDEDDEYIQIARRGMAEDPLAEAEFSNLARAFYTLALEQGEAL